MARVFDGEQNTNCPRYFLFTIQRHKKSSCHGCQMMMDGPDTENKVASTDISFKVVGIFIEINLMIIGSFLEDKSASYRLACWTVFPSLMENADGNRIGERKKIP